MPAVVEEIPRFLDVRQVAQYLNLNEKKVYALASEGRIPGTKVTGKWMFPRDLIDRWMLESSHGGLLADRLLMAGADDPLLHRVVRNLGRDAGARALVSYTPTGTRPGLELLQAHRADACPLHWGPIEESHLRHPA
ncbi:MAG: helix-turn-helix domain-containing protein, partial [Chromatiaceae bacterium]